MRQATPEDSIGVTEAAKMLGTYRKQVLRLIIRGELPGWFKISNAPNSPYVGPRQSVLDYLEKKRALAVKAKAR